MPDNVTSEESQNNATQDINYEASMSDAASTDAPSDLGSWIDEADVERKSQGMPGLDTPLPSRVYTAADGIEGSFNDAVEMPGAAPLGPVTAEASQNVWTIENVLGSMAWGTGDALKNVTDFLEAGGVDVRKAFEKHVLGRSDAELDTIVTPTEAMTGQKENTNLAELLGIAEPEDMGLKAVAYLTPALVAGLAGPAFLESTPFLQSVAGYTGKGLLSFLGRGGGQVVSKSLAAIASDATYFATATERDGDNFASQIEQFTNREDFVGKAARAYFKTIPGAEWMVHQSDDSEVTKGFKNALDAAYGTLIGPLMYASLKGTKAVYEGIRGSNAAKEWVANNLGKEIAPTAEMLTKIDQELSTEQALDALFGTPKNKTPELDMDINPASVDNLASTTTTATVMDESGATLAQGTPLSDGPSIVDQLKAAREETIQYELDSIKISNDKVKKAAALPKAIQEQTDSGVNFQKEDFDEALLAASSDPNKMLRVLRDWGDFVVGDDAPLVTGAGAKLWNSGPYTLTGNILDSIKRVTTATPERLDDAVKWLTEQGDMPDDVAKRLIEAGSVSTSKVYEADRSQLSIGLVLRNSIVPQIQKLSKLIMDPSVVPGSADETLILDRMKELRNQALGLQETQKNLRSASGLLLQGSQVDVELDRTLDLMTGRKKELMSQVPAASIDYPKTLAEELQELKLLAGLVSKTTPNGTLSAIQGVNAAKEHPAWGIIAKTPALLDKVGASLAFAGMLAHPKTTSTVLQSSGVSVLVDSLSAKLGTAVVKTMANVKGGTKESLFKARMLGEPIDPLQYEAINYGAMVRLKSGAHSFATGIKSFVDPSLQDTYAVGNAIYKPKNPLSLESVEEIFGSETADAWSSLGKGIPSRLLNLAGKGLGLPGHALGSVETMINHGALMGSVAENIFYAGRKMGLKGKALDQFIKENTYSVLTDVIITSKLGNMPLQNKLGLGHDQLLAIAQKSAESADMSSMRMTGKGGMSSSEATSELADTAFFKVKDSLEAGLSNMPFVPNLLRAVIIPFGTTSANIAHRVVSPIQVWMNLVSSAVGGPAIGGTYVREVLQGLHGPQKQAAYLGSALMWSMVSAAATADYYLNQNSDKLSPVGRAAEVEAATERGTNYGEFSVGGQRLTATGISPYSAWFTNSRRLVQIVDNKDNLDYVTLGKQITDLTSESVPVGGMFQALQETFAGATSGSDDGVDAVQKTLSIITSKLSKAFSNPARVGDLFNERGYGKYVTVLNAGPRVAALTAAAGSDRRFKVLLYDLKGSNVPDPYNPHTPKEYWESLGLPVLEPLDDSPFGNLLEDMEQHGLTMTPLNKKITIALGNGTGSIPIDTQHFYSARRGKHLWDIYNEYVSQYKGPPESLRLKGRDDFTLQEQLDAIASEYTDQYGNINNSTSFLSHGRKKTKVIGEVTQRCQRVLEKAHAEALERLKATIEAEGSDFVNFNDESLPDYIEAVTSDLQEAAAQPEPNNTLPQN